MKERLHKSNNESKKDPAAQKSNLNPLQENEEINKKKKSTNNSLYPGFEFKETPVFPESKPNKGLPRDIQLDMERSFGANFSNVEIHKNSTRAQELNAHAFTQGNSVHFAPGNSNFDSAKGIDLLGHELAHVVQQRKGIVKPSIDTPKLKINDENANEQEADNIGEKISNNSLRQSISPISQNTPNHATGDVIQKRDVVTINYNNIAKDIFEAIDGWGTDEEKVYNALAKLRKNPASITKLKEVYKAKYKTDLQTDLEGDFSKDELAHVNNLMAKGETYTKRKKKSINYGQLAIKIHKATSGPGTDEEAVYEALLQLNNNPVLIDKLKKEYKSKYKVALITVLIDDFKDDELAYVMELIEDKTTKEQVNVESKKEAKEAKKIIETIKKDYGIDVNSQAGVDAIRKDYPTVSSKVLDQLNTTAWEYKEIVALKKALDDFAPILGDKRKKSTRKGVAQEVTTVSKLDQGIPDDDPKANLDTTTIGEYVESSKNFSLFTKGTYSSIDFTDSNKQIRGTTVHEITHGLLEYREPDFVTQMDFWFDKSTKSGKKGAEKPITPYGEGSATEDFAEAVMYYFVEPTTLLKDAPKRHKFIKDSIKAWK